MPDDTRRERSALADAEHLSAHQAPRSATSGATATRHVPAGLVQLAEAVTAWLADTRVMVPLELAVDWARHARADAYEAGWSAGRLDLIADEKRAQMGIARALRDSAPPPFQWHVCCRACRLGGHRPGCRSCEDRTRETFGEPHPDDYRGQDGAA